MTKLTVASALAVLLMSPSLLLAQAPSVAGTVQEIDMAAGKVTLDHGPIPNLNMDAMEMAWTVQDSAMLKGLSRGDQVQFTADRVNGSLTVTRIQKSK